MTVPVLIGVGGNVNPQHRLPEAVRLLRRSLSSVQVSTFYHTSPIRDRPPAPPYVNGVIAAKTRHSAEALKCMLRHIEHACGRRRHGDMGEFCPLDLDILAFGNTVDPDADLPSAELLTRDFCLIPAAELWPAWHHPIERKTLRELVSVAFPVLRRIREPITFSIDAVDA